MEAIESFCGEPRNAPLVRATYRELAKSQACLLPSLLVGRRQPQRPGPDEPLMWTPMLWLEQSEEVWVPAETVFFPFLPEQFDTQRFFPSSSDGLAAGSSYLEATIHALYAKIERHYLALSGLGLVDTVELSLDELDCFPVGRWNRESSEGMPLRFWTHLIPGLKNLPMLFVSRGEWGGMGCSANVEMSALRAISEAFQSHALGVSGSREDIGRHRLPTPSTRQAAVGSAARLSLAEYRREVWDVEFTDLRDELRFLLDWVHQAGFPMTLIANLTRNGVGFPVVRAVVPGMLFLSTTHIESAPRKSKTPNQARYPNIEEGR